MTAPAEGLVVESLAVARAGRRVVHDVSFALGPGEVLAVVGPNGAGKSSLLEAVLGLLPLAAGRVTFQGRALRNLAARSRVFSYMPDEAEPPAEVRVDTLLAHAERFGRVPADQALALAVRLHVRPLARERAGRLSRGEKRRVSLYLALCTSRPVVVLDEPLAAFDPLQLLEVLPLLRDLAATGTAVLMSVHQMSDAEKIASRVLVLDAGVVVAIGTLAGLRTQAGRGEGTLEEVVVELLRRRQSHVRA